VAANARFIVTHNLKDFANAQNFGNRHVTFECDRSVAMTTVSVNLPDSLAQKAKELAHQDGITLDHLVSLAVAEKLAVWMNDEYVAQRARRATRERFEAALSQVPDVEPEEHDKL
jgi:hypothetical protein